MTTSANRDDARVLHDIQINMALGIFLVFFGLVVLVSIFFTETSIGRLTNLGAGALIGGIGSAMVYRAWRLKKSQ